MDVQEMFDELDDHGFTDTGAVRKLAMLNDTLYDACSRESWPHLETTATLTFAGGSSTPSNQPADLKSVMVLIHTDTRYKLQWSRLDALEGSGLDLTQAGHPTSYYFVGTSLNFIPVPPAGDTLRLRYIKIPAALLASTTSANVPFPVQHHRVLILGALQRLYDMEDDPELAARFMAQYEQRLAMAANDVFNRQQDRPDMIYTDPWFDGDDYD